MTSAARVAAVPADAAARQWKRDFARVYALQERCSSAQAEYAAAILCDSLSLLAPTRAVMTVLGDRDLLLALRIATQEPFGRPPLGGFGVADAVPLAQRG